MKTSNKICLRIITTLFLCQLAQPLLAQKKPQPFKLEASIGAQYDSNLTVEQIDVDTTQDDVAVLLKIDADYKISLSKKFNLDLGYSLSQSLHNDLDQFDIQNHLLSAGLDYDVDRKTSAGLNLNYADSSLDGKDLIKLTQLSPFLSHYISKQLFIRSAFDLTDKSFDGRSNRDADAWAFNVDLYYFINGPRHYLIGGYKYKEEDAVTAQFDYNAYQFKLRWIKRLTLMEKQAKLKLGWRYEQRDYDDTSSAAGVRREDNRHRWSADLEFPLKDNTSILVEYEYRNYGSNLDSADYIEHLSSIKLQHRFF